MNFWTFSFKSQRQWTVSSENGGVGPSLRGGDDGDTSWHWRRMKGFDACLRKQHGGEKNYLSIYHLFICLYTSARARVHVRVCVHLRVHVYTSVFLPASDKRMIAAQRREERIVAALSITG